MAKIVNDNELKCGIYKITNKVNNYVYIGQSINIYRRWNEHIRALNKNIHANKYLQNSWNKYGEDNFEFEIIELCEIGLLDENEKYWIKTYNSYAKLEDSKGYNLTEGGECVDRFKVCMFKKNGDYIITFENIYDASLELGVNYYLIASCCKGSIENIDDYVFIYEKDYKQYFKFKERFSFTPNKISKCNNIYSDNLKNVINKLTISSKAFLFHFSNYLDGDNSIVMNHGRPTIEQYLELMGVGRTKLYEIFKELEENELIFRERCGGKLIIYFNPKYISVNKISDSTMKMFE